MGRILGSLIVFILLVFGAKGCISDYIEGEDKELVASYERMLSEETKTLAVLDEEYTERTIKVMKVPIKYYDFTFKYSVDDITYDGEYTTDSIPELPLVTVYYDKENPIKYAIDPQKGIEKQKDKGSIIDLLVGLLFAILTIPAAYGVYESIREFIKKSKEFMEDL